MLTKKSSQIMKIMLKISVKPKPNARHSQKIFLQRFQIACTKVLAGKCNGPPEQMHFAISYVKIFKVQRQGRTCNGILAKELIPLWINTLETEKKLLPGYQPEYRSSAHASDLSTRSASYETQTGIHPASDAGKRITITVLTILEIVVAMATPATPDEIRSPAAGSGLHSKFQR